MPAVSHQCHPSAASVSCNSASPELRCKSVSCCSNVKYVKPGDSPTCQPFLITREPGVWKHPRLIPLQGDECHYLHLRLLLQIKATAILKRIATNRYVPFQEWGSYFSSRGPTPKNIVVFIVDRAVVLICVACWILARQSDLRLSGPFTGGRYTDESPDRIHIRMLHGQSISTSTTPGPSIFTRWGWTPQLCFESRS